jgi:heme-degrading monooxygenase HmoA
MGNSLLIFSGFNFSLLTSYFLLLMYVIIWEFIVKSDFIERFELDYGANGSWAKLFQRDSNYLGTELLRKKDQERVYLTIDRWRSKEDYHNFRWSNLNEYQLIDQACEALTEHEALIGTYEWL